MPSLWDDAGVPRDECAESGLEQLRFLLAYSPDFNPIELAFAKLKTHLRAVAARTFDPLVDAIGEGLTAITATDIAGFYHHCGYALPRQPL